MSSIKDRPSERFSGNRNTTVEISKPGLKLIEELVNLPNIEVSRLAQQLLASEDLQNPSKERVRVILVRAGDFGINNYERDFDVVNNKLSSSGLSLCPQLTAAELALSDTDLLRKYEKTYVLSTPLPDQFCAPVFFTLHRWDGKLKLAAEAPPCDWQPNDVVAVRLR